MIHEKCDIIIGHFRDVETVIVFICHILLVDAEAEGDRKSREREKPGSPISTMADHKANSYCSLMKVNNAFFFFFFDDDEHALMNHALLYQGHLLNK